MNPWRIITTEIGSRRYDGSWGEIASLECPRCGSLQKEDVYDCPTCGGGAIHGTVDGLIVCRACGGFGPLDHERIQVHCPEDYSLDCGE